MDTPRSPAAVLLDAFDIGESTEPDEQFVVDSRDKAAWALSKIRQRRDQYRDEVAPLEKAAEALQEELERVTDLIADAAQRRDHDTSFLQAGLEAYARRLREESDGKIKSLKLPGGVVKTTSSPRKVVVVDDEKAATALALQGLDSDDIVKITRKVLLQGLRKRLDVNDDGEVYDPDSGEILGQAADFSLDVAPEEVTVKVEVEGGDS